MMNCWFLFWFDCDWMATICLETGVYINYGSTTQGLRWNSSVKNDTRDIPGECFFYNSEFKHRCLGYALRENPGESIWHFNSTSDQQHQQYHDELGEAENKGK